MPGRALGLGLVCGALANAATEPHPIFGFDVVTECPSVPREILRPRGVWADASACDAAAHTLGALFRENFTTHESWVIWWFQKLTAVFVRPLSPTWTAL